MSYILRKPLKRIKKNTLKVPIYKYRVRVITVSNKLNELIGRDLRSFN